MFLNYYPKLYQGHERWYNLWWPWYNFKVPATSDRSDWKLSFPSKVLSSRLQTWLDWHQKHFNVLGEDEVYLTPSLPQPVKFPGWKMYGRACKQYIFLSCNTSVFNAMPFDGDPFTCQCEKEDTQKRLKGFKFRTLMGRFEMTSWQWRA